MRQSGFTMVEMMVTLVIAMAVLAGLSEAFYSGQASYSVQDRLGELQESGRYAIYFLQRDLRMAGYPKFQGQTLTPPFVLSGAANAISSSGTGNNGSDQIAIQYLADTQGVTDCLGNNVAVGTMVINTYAVSLDTDYNPPRSRLTCNGQPIVEGIEAMQVLYGVDTDNYPGGNGDGFADRYVPLNDPIFADLSVWLTRVVSVRVAVLASTVTPVFGDQTADNSSTKFTLLDAAPVGPLATGVRGKVFTATVELRNKSDKNTSS